ncbi:hypothetical protein DPEC_G00217650 [Dallia pectoralis]|uniref:Uncharacterized protein n=1 Tax=Dallia pectoralis TaxID=75939 RepID=A0ACC2G387_DALPE|nr:hypothetical protein DPEC_G00217650 [Dallia pectoralis]
MENVMKDLNVVVYLDDLLVMGRDETEHLMNLDRVLQRLQENGLRVKKAKCDFGKTQIEYLGHTLDGKGVYPSKDKRTELEPLFSTPHLMDKSIQ